MAITGAPDLSRPSQARAGMRLDSRYRLDALASEPGAAEEWLAVDLLLSRPVTVRILPPGLRLADAALAPALAAGRLTDPRLARIYDADDRGPCPYIVCERPPGMYLDELIATGLPDPAIAAVVIAEAAGALAAAHDAGAHHLHLTPRSLLWEPGGVKVTGVGIEAALHRTTLPDPAAADATALGHVLYALLTGYWPGARKTALPAAPALRGGTCAPRQARAGIPAALNAITCRAMLTHLAPGEPPLASPASLAVALRSAIPRLRAEVPADHPPRTPAPAIVIPPARHRTTRRHTALRPLADVR